MKSIYLRRNKYFQGKIKVFKIVMEYKENLNKLEKENNDVKMGNYMILLFTRTIYYLFL